ncbi:hypothetical protein CROQUDRAFT_21695, partial [Cronartium quercuum f. sp. fusiforme G11]
PPNKIVKQFKPAQLIIYMPAEKAPFKGGKPKEITDMVNKALGSIKARLDGELIWVRGASVLPSGNIKLYVASQHIKAWLLHNKHLWSTLAHPDLVTTQTRFPVLIHSVPMDIDPASGEFIASFVAENVIPKDEISGMRWHVKPSGEVAHSSILMI